ncbi:MAG TPA: CHRD domain-containing protein [Dongiaceae bacterium]|nr:CHRD domain-containing protein [Dongiaceae bacterium]
MKTIDITGVRSMAALAVACLFALITAGCGGGDMSTPARTIAAAKASSASIMTLSAVLNGAQEVPPTASAATGTATVTIDAARTTINVTMTTQGFTVPVTASHIHFGPVGTNGGVLLSLFAAPAVFPATLTKTLTSADFAPDVAHGIITFADAVNAILAGNTYINIHTQANLGGEIRGQLMLQ